MELALAARRRKSALRVWQVRPRNAEPMRSAYLTLSLTTATEAERVHALLADGGEIFMPLTETIFAERFSMLRDQFGTSWMILGPTRA